MRVESFSGGGLKWRDLWQGGVKGRSSGSESGGVLETRYLYRCSGDRRSFWKASTRTRELTRDADVTSKLICPLCRDYLDTKPQCSVRDVSDLDLEF